jgi:hypothetical protein
MKIRLVLAAALWALALSTAAYAASPQYCAFYAREYSRQFSLGVQEAQTELDIADQAYYRCLNQDEDPPLPENSSYMGENEAATGGPFIPVAKSTEADSPVVPVDPAPEPAGGLTSRSGLKPWSTQWASWCQEHFPNSFDVETGFVRPYSGRPSFC